MVDGNDDKSIKQKLEVLAAEGRIKELQEDMAEIQKGSLEEARKLLEINKEQLAIAIKKKEIEQIGLISKQQSGTATAKELKDLEDNIVVSEQLRKNAKDTAKIGENRLKLLEKEDRHNQHIRGDVLGIRKEEERRKVKLEEIRNVIANTPKADLIYSIKEKALEAAAAFAAKIFVAAMAFDKLSAGINAATNTGGEFNSIMTDGAVSLGRYGVDAEKMGESFVALRSNFADMSNMSKDAQEELSGFAAKMAVAGISTETTSRFLNTATKSMGMGVKQVEKYEKELFAFSRANGISMKSIDAGLASVMPRLTAFGKDGPKIFKDLALQAKQMGVEMDKVLNITEGFTTFEGAAEAAGELNSMLGGNVIDSLELLKASSEDPAKAMEILRDGLNSTGKSFIDLSNSQKRAYADALKTDPDTLSRVMNMTSEAAKEAAMNEEKFNDAIAKFVPIGEKMKALFAKMAPLIGLIGQGLAALVDFFVWLIEIPVVGWVILGVGAISLLVSVVGALGLAFFMIAGQIATAAGALGLITTAGTAATVAVAATGTATLVAGGEMAAGAGTASVGILASIGTLIAGMGTFGAFATALLPLLLPLAAVILAIGFAFFLAGTGIALVLAGIAGVVVALAYLMKTLIDGGAATLSAAVGFAVMGGSLYLLALGLAAVGTMGSIGIGVLLVLTGLILSLGMSFSMIGEGMEKSQIGIKAFSDLEITKLVTIKDKLSLMADQMERLSSAAIAFSLAMANPALMPIMAIAAAVAPSQTTAANTINSVSASSKAGGPTSAPMTANITIEVPIQIDGKQIDKRIIHKIVQLAVNQNDEMMSPTGKTTGLQGIV